MPNIITGEPTPSGGYFSVESNFDYKYPDGLDLRPTSRTHKFVVDHIMQMARASANYMSKRHKSWKEIDRILTVFTPLDDEELRSKDKDPRKPVSIVFPYTYAILESLLSYMCAAYFQDPMFSYKGHGPEDAMGAILLTKAVDLHCNRSKVPLALHTMFRDAFAYGLGIVVPSWKKEYIQAYRPEQVGYFSRLSDMFKTEGVRKVLKEELLYEGNTLINIDPYKALLDPNTPIQKFQESEFFGWVENTNFNTLLSEEKDEEDLFNVKYLRHKKPARTCILDKDPSDRELRFGGSSVDDAISTMSHPVDVVHLYANIIPKDWDLGESEYPEKWYFKIAGDDLVITAKPIGLHHGKYPAAVCSPDYDGYSTAPMSRLEMLFGLQGTLDWLFNSHIKNVRKAINDMFVYDPYLINSKDLENPKEGWLIRTRRPAWGKGVQHAMQQLTVNDVTRQNISDSSFLVQWMQKIGGTDESMMGALRQGGPERLTGAEFQGTRQGALSRLERVAKIVGWQAMQDIGFFFAAHTQQLMTEESYIPILGQWEALLQQEYSQSIQQGRMKIKPTDLLVAFDVMIRDGSIPGGNYSDVWEKMFEQVATIPELANKFDLVRIFKHIARNNGANNVEEFVKIQVLPDQQIQQQVQQGNMVPMDQSQMGGF